ncbi:MAG: (2Fe-2S)-binding protein [Thermomicrobiales bacterium]|nr:(2Fe-2S)-binding protein [Thermomicrobiales bacterium]
MAEADPPAWGAERITEHSILGLASVAAWVTFTFDGEAVEAIAGEPLLAALLASGRRVLRTMPRFGDPRGGYCLVGRCADCMVVVDGIPSVRACMTAVAAGMVVRTQHGAADDRDLSEEPAE